MGKKNKKGGAAAAANLPVASPAAGGFVANNAGTTIQLSSSTPINSVANIVNMLKNPSDNVRARACQAIASTVVRASLASLATSGCIDILVQLVSDKSVSVGIAALGALRNTLAEVGKDAAVLLNKKNIVTLTMDLLSAIAAISPQVPATGTLSIKQNPNLPWYAVSIQDLLKLQIQTIAVLALTCEHCEDAVATFSKKQTESNGVHVGHLLVLSADLSTPLHASLAVQAMQALHVLTHNNPLLNNALCKLPGVTDHLTRTAQLISPTDSTSLSPSAATSQSIASHAQAMCDTLSSFITSGRASLGTAFSLLDLPPSVAEISALSAGIAINLATTLIQQQDPSASSLSSSSETLTALLRPAITVLTSLLSSSPYEPLTSVLSSLEIISAHLVEVAAAVSRGDATLPKPAPFTFNQAVEAGAITSPSEAKAAETSIKTVTSMTTTGGTKNGVNGSNDGELVNPLAEVYGEADADAEKGFDDADADMPKEDLPIDQLWDDACLALVRLAMKHVSAVQIALDSATSMFSLLEVDDGNDDEGKQAEGPSSLPKSTSPLHTTVAQAVASLLSSSDSSSSSSTSTPRGILSPLMSLIGSRLLPPPPTLSPRPTPSQIVTSSPDLLNQQQFAPSLPLSSYPDVSGLDATTATSYQAAAHQASSLDPSLHLQLHMRLSHEPCTLITKSLDALRVNALQSLSAAVMFLPPSTLGETTETAVTLFNAVSSASSMVVLPRQLRTTAPQPTSYSDSPAYLFAQLSSSDATSSSTQESKSDTPSGNKTKPALTLYEQCVTGSIDEVEAITSALLHISNLPQVSVFSSFPLYTHYPIRTSLSLGYILITSHHISPLFLSHCCIFICISISFSGEINSFSRLDLSY